MLTLCPSHRWSSLWCPLCPVFTRPLSLQWSLRSSQTPKSAASVQVLIKAGSVGTVLSVTRHPSWPLSSPSASPLQQWKRWRELRDYTRLSSDYKPASVSHIFKSPGRRVCVRERERMKKECVSLCLCGCCGERLYVWCGGGLKEIGYWRRRRIWRWGGAGVLKPPALMPLHASDRKHRGNTWMNVKEINGWTAKLPLPFSLASLKCLEMPSVCCECAYAHKHSGNVFLSFTSFFIKNCHSLSRSLWLNHHSPPVAMETTFLNGAEMNLLLFVIPWYYVLSLYTIMRSLQWSVNNEHWCLWESFVGRGFIQQFIHRFITCFLGALVNRGNII